MTVSTQPRPVQVVTAFLASGGRVALFRRSGRVGTYRGAWAGVSGYVERLPLDQAYLELREEAGLAPEHVRLRGIGTPVVVEDRELGRTWLVHPFLFEIDDPDSITLDWESTRVEWVSPGQLVDRECVPGLDRALASVWPPFGDDELWAALSAAATDTVRGAASLALAALDAVGESLARDPSAGVIRHARALAASRSSMGVFPHLAALLLSGQPVSELSCALTQATAASARHAAEALRPHRRLFTNSYSSSVREALAIRQAMTEPLEVVVTESRPGLEGVTLARELRDLGIQVSVITDAQAGVFVPEADAVVVGCDSITDDDRVQNKVGTSLAVAAARSSDVPCYAIAQTLKMVPPGFPSPLEEQDPSAVGTEPGISFRNIVFDSTPLCQFETVFTEEGALTREGLAEVRRRLSASGLLT